MNINTSRKEGSVNQFGWLVFILSVLLTLPWIGLGNFYTRGEPREALVAVEMLEQGNFILPFFQGEFAFKPPMLHWLVALFSLPQGYVSEITARLPSALACIVMCCAFYSFVSKRFSPSRMRQIRKGLKNGAEVRETHDPAEIQAFARMLHRVYSFKVRRHFPSMRFFREMEHWLTEGEHSRIFIVTYHGRIIGGSACIYSGTNAYLWFSGGMRKTYARQYPGILAVWYALVDAKQRGYRHLEFMDVGLPVHKHGYREFVKRFGGRQISTRRWFRLRWQWLNKLLNWLYG